MSTNLARAIEVIDRTAEKVGTRAPLLAQALAADNPDVRVIANLMMLAARR